ncbi:MarR family winged helix-turn-helix transcriptional regulator [Aureibacter tunicatorum]|uniref:DNA-binding MarR family transcriptional regulator n=1 Tax=Aureibacter tunicatorum TaxID=866807 RepID=A0AAE3XM20_9BACT|nr:MarR family transcriptional regulator [Aureibacter tunicatorum]MDR6238912.1 DNA-binding MarR family transcriptional regulator [Aureibacter tunicatorum]
MNIYLKAIHKLIRTGHWITDCVGAELKEFDITEPQYNVLRILSSSGDEAMTVKEIQDRMVQRSSNVSRIIDKLLAKGYVSRKECQHNRRKMDISMTDEGHSILALLDQKVSAFHKPLKQKLSDEELRALDKILTKYSGLD